MSNVKLARAFLKAFVPRLVIQTGACARALCAANSAVRSPDAEPEVQPRAGAGEREGEPGPRLVSTRRSKKHETRRPTPRPTGFLYAAVGRYYSLASTVAHTRSITVTRGAETAVASRWILEEPATQAAATQSPATQSPATQSPATQSHGRIEWRRPQQSGRRAAEQAWLGLGLGLGLG